MRVQDHCHSCIIPISRIPRIYFFFVCSSSISCFKGRRVRLTFVFPFLCVQTVCVHGNSTNIYNTVDLLSCCARFFVCAKKMPGTRLNCCDTLQALVVFVRGDGAGGVIGLYDAQFNIEISRASYNTSHSLLLWLSLLIAQLTAT